MALIVTKFGGTSVATPERIRKVARRLIDLYHQGNEVVCVVSAMGHETDRLLALAREVSGHPSKREVDMLLTTGEQVSMALLAMAVQDMGVRCVSHTGGQVGIITNSIHTKAQISEVRAQRLREDLAQGHIVIVAGFQGVTPDGEITTLGRGGSDTTAVAIAASLQADLCEIYSDVDGVYSADPRICPKARKIEEISYEEMLELSASGSGVLQMRAVEFARRFGVVIHSRSSFNTNPGTLVKEVGTQMEAAVVSGIALDRSHAKITMRHVPDQPGIAGRIFAALAEAQVCVDIIIQDVSHNGVTDLSFTCPLDDLEMAEQVACRLNDELHAEGFSVNPHIAKVSVVGAGMGKNPGIAATMFTTLCDAGINISMISTSTIRISTIIDEDRADEAVQRLHTAFGLDSESMVSVEGA